MTTPENDNEPQRSRTGEFPAAPSTSQRDLAPVTNGDLRRQFKWQDAAIVIAILGGFLTGYIHLIGVAKAQSDAGVQPLKTEVEAVSKRLERHETDANMTHGLLKKDLSEVQTDIRALYRAVMTGRPQDRLERPAPTRPIDAGPP